MNNFISDVQKKLAPQKPSQDQSYKKEGNPFAGVMGFAIATAMGATLGLLFAPKSGVEIQQDVKDQADKLAKKFTKSREELQETVKDIFGEVSEELEKNYIELKGNVLAGVAYLKDNVSITQKKYDEIVDNSIQEFSKGKKWSETAIQNLQKNLFGSWNELKIALDTETAKKTHQVKKATNKVKKTGKKMIKKGKTEVKKVVKKAKK